MPRRLTLVEHFLLTVFLASVCCAGVELFLWFVHVDAVYGCVPDWTCEPGVVISIEP